MLIAIPIQVRRAQTVPSLNVLTAERRYALTAERGAAGNRSVSHAVITT